MFQWMRAVDHIDSAEEQEWLIQEFMGEETALEKLFKSMDKDGDGTVTKEVTVIIVIIVITTHACFYAPSNDRLYKKLEPQGIY